MEKVRPILTNADPLRPWLLAALTALVICRPLFPSEGAAASGDGLPVAMLWLSLPLLWLLGLLRAPTSRVRFGWIDGGVLLLVAWHTAAGVRAVYCGSPRPALNQLWEWIGLGAAFLMARQLIVGRREVRAVVVAMLALAAALAAYGVYQQVYELPATRAMYAADPDAALRSIGVWHAPDAPQRVLFERRLASQQPMATFALTNSLAAFLAPWLIVALGVVWTFRSRRRWFVAAVWLLPLAVCLVLTRSRSAYLAAGLGGIALLVAASKLRQSKRLLRVAAVGLLTVVAAGVLASRLEPQWQEKSQKSLGYRFEYWRASCGLIGDAPLWGCGPGNFQAAYTRYKLPEASEEVADPHNLLLELAATAGLPALAIFGTVLALFAWQLRTSPPADEEEESPGAEPERPGLVAGGALAGALLAPWASVLIGSPTTPLVVLLVSAFLVGSFMLAWPWIAQGRLSARLLGLGAGVLVLNLLAAGGIGYPAVAGSLWLLLALALNLSADCFHARLGRRQAALLALFSAGLCLACYATAYRPVVEAEAHLRRAVADPLKAEAELRAAAAADPYAARPWLELAARAYSQWRTDRQPERLQRCTDSLEHALRLGPQENGLWTIAGDVYLGVFSLTKRGDHAAAAVRCCRQAVDLYPNSAILRAKLAISLKAQGAEREFGLEAAEALRLDRLTPHEDKKLPADLRRALPSGETPKAVRALDATEAVH